MHKRRVMATVMAIKKKEFRLLAAKITENVEAAVGFAKKEFTYRKL